MSAYTYNPATNVYTFPAAKLQRILRRVGQTKEQCAAEDDRENAAKLRALEEDGLRAAVGSLRAGKGRTVDEVRDTIAKGKR